MVSEGPTQLTPDELIGVQVTVKETKNTRGLGIAGSPGVIEYASTDGIQVTVNGFGGLAGPFPLTIDDVELPA